MRGRRRRGSTDPSDDVVGMAGWMYTDLLLALAVVFLGSIAMLVYGGTSDEGEVEGPLSEQAAEETTTSTTSTTLPPVQCTILYSLANNDADKDNRFRIEVSSAGTDDAFASSVEEALVAEIENQNRLIDEHNRTVKDGNPGYPHFDLKNLRVGMVLSYGGAYGVSPAEGRQTAERAANRLQTLLPEQFDRSTVRIFYDTSLLRGQSKIEIFPTITDDCNSLPRAIED